MARQKYVTLGSARFEIDKISLWMCLNGSTFVWVGPVRDTVSLGMNYTYPYKIPGDHTRRLDRVFRERGLYLCPTKLRFRQIFQVHGFYRGMGKSAAAEARWAERFETIEIEVEDDTPEEWVVLDAAE